MKCCDDCERCFETGQITDTMAGGLCPRCYQRWINAAKGLLEAAARLRAMRMGVKVGAA